jgi:hypothetical protein
VSTPIYLTGSASAGRGTRDTLGLLVTPDNGLDSQLAEWPQWAADNGVYGAFKAGRPYDPLRWAEWLQRIVTRPAWTGWTPEQHEVRGRRGLRAADHHLFAVLPDVVGDWRGTFANSYPWVPLVRELGLCPALAAQDGLEARDIDWDGIDCLFIGGTDDWKLSDAAARLVHEAHYWGRWVHMGRVNSRLRYQRAAAMGVDSVDGTYIKFGPDVNLPKLTGWLDRAEQTLFGTEEFAETRP